MTENELAFEKYINHRFDELKELIILKGREYRRNNDPFHNFNEGAKKNNSTPEEVLKGFLLKHEISRDDIITDIISGQKVSTKLIKEKCGDIIIYHLLLESLINLQRNEYTDS